MSKICLFLRQNNNSHIKTQKIMNKLFKNSFAGVRKIAALGVVCMLFFAVVSCEKAEHEEPEITEVFTSRFRINHDAGQFLMFDQLTPEFVIDPVNLSERFQRDTFVQATVGRIGEKKNEFGHPRVKIMDIQETVLRDGTFLVGPYDERELVLKRVFLNRYGARLTVPILPSDIMIPTNFPEDFQVEMDYDIVLVTYRYTGEKDPEGYVFIEIVEIQKFNKPTQTRIR